jgi:AbrB family looped-hinge helix DNA binding protein
MITAKITSKGQVTIPKSVREMLGVRPGESIGFEEKNGALLITKVIAESPFNKWMGKLTHLKGKRSDEIIKETRGHDNRR